MKKWLIGMFFIILFVNVVISVNTNQLDETGVNNENLQTAEVGEMQKASNQFLDQEVKIPQWLQTVSKLLFGLGPEKTVTLQMLVLYSVVWLITLYIISLFVRFVPTFSGPLTYLVSFIIMVLVGLAGGLNLAVGTLLSISNFFGLLEGWSIARLFFSFIILAGILFLFSKIAAYIKKETGISKMEEAGRNIAIGSAYGKAVSQAVLKRAEGQESSL